MKCRVTYVTGCAPNLPWWRAMNMSTEEIKAYNGGFMKYETKEFEDGGLLQTERVIDD